MRDHAPPPFAEELLRRLLDRADGEAVLGDLAETYRAKCEAGCDSSRARRWYRREAVLLLFHALVSRRKNVNGHRRFVPGMVSVALNVIAMAAFWLVAFGLIQSAQRIDGGWQLAAVAQVIACGAGVAIALRLRARLCLYFVAGQLAFTLAELVIHAVYGIGAAQGAPTHFAVMLAGTLGVLLGVFIVAANKSARPLSSPTACSAP